MGTCLRKSTPRRLPRMASKRRCDTRALRERVIREERKGKGGAWAWGLLDPAKLPGVAHRTRRICDTQASFAMSPLRLAVRDTERARPREARQLRRGEL